MLQDQIRQIRKKNGMTQEELAEALGVTAASVSKWETGQTSPELGVLCAMADLFEVSVDSLLGHTLKGNRKKQLLEQLATFKQQHAYDQAKETAQLLLRSYPNDYEAVDAAANLYYCIYISTRDTAAMETSIALVKRLFPLAKADEKMRFPLLSRLANSYELLQDWDKARKCYKEGNVDGGNDRPLAYLQAREKGDRDAVEKISSLFATSLFHMVTDVLNIRELWEENGETKKAIAAVKWGIQAIEACGASLCKAYTPLLITLYLSLMGMDAEHASVYLPRITELAAGESNGEGTEFLLIEDVALAASQDLYDQGLLQNLIAQLGVAEGVSSGETGREG